MSIYLGHEFTSGKCSRCGAAETSVREYRTSCAKAPPVGTPSEVATIQTPETMNVASPTLDGASHGSSPSKTTRACPYCAEDVLVAAKLCKHCKSPLEPTAEISLPASAAAAADNRPGPRPEVSLPNANTGETGVVRGSGGISRLLVILAVLLLCGLAVWLGGRLLLNPAAATCATVNLVPLFPGFALRAVDCSDGHNRNVVCDPVGGTMYACSCAIDDRMLGSDVAFDRSNLASGSTSSGGTEQARENEWLMRVRQVIGGGLHWSDSGGSICSSYAEMQIETE